MRSHILSLAAVAALGAGIAVAGVLPASASTDSLTWGACPTGAPAPQECATIQVPLDYARPDGRRIAVEVSRIKAADPAKRKGVLLANGGGPGPSLDVPTAFAGFMPQSVRDSYDVVAFDPRGIGYSTPVNCGRGKDELTRDLQFSVFSFPAADGSIDANVAYSKRMAKQCAAASGDLLPHITTANVARDMDQIRQALGERTVSYYGISWGTKVGALYRALFPDTVDRVVIDSSVDPTKQGYDDFREFSGAMEDRWPDLAAFGAANDKTVHLGRTERAVRKNFLALAAKLDRHPVKLAETKAPINGNYLRLFTWQLSYNDAAMIASDQAPVPPLATFWAAAGNAAAGKATKADREALAAQANHLVESATSLPGVPTDNLLSAGWAFSCGDAAWPRDVRTYARNTAADRKQYPLTAGGPANFAPCSAWATRPGEPEPAVTQLGKRNVLILQNERDPATPLRTAQGMHRALGSDSALITVDAGGHGVLIHPQPSRCAIGALEAYLVDGEFPAADKAC